MDSAVNEERHPANGVMLNVREQGAGEHTLVFLHYYGGSSRTWRFVMDALAGRARCLAVDLRGWGASDGPLSGYGVDDMADDVAALTSTLGLERYTLVGHSMGGKAALALAARRPPGLAALALIAPSPPTPEPMTNAARASLRGAYGHSDAARATLQEIAALPLPAEGVTQALADYQRASRAAWMAWLDVGSREDISARMGRIAVPASVLVGSKDPVIPVEVARREIVERIAGARLTDAPGAGHLLPLEAPQAVAEFLSGEPSQDLSQKSGGGPVPRP